MMRHLFVLGSLLLAPLIPSASAETIRFQNLPSNTGYGTYNGFVTAAVNGTATDLVCDDYLHTTYVPSGPFTYEVSTLTGVNPLQYARFVNPADWSRSVTQYEEAAFLVLQLSEQPSSRRDQTADLQYALWSLFTPSTPERGTSAALLSEAAAAVAGAQIDPLLYSRLRIYTPAIPYTSNQEFLSLVDPGTLSDDSVVAQVAPEPSTASLIGAGAAMVVAALLLRRRHLRLRAERRDPAGLK